MEKYRREVLRGQVFFCLGLICFLCTGWKVSAKEYTGYVDVPYEIYSIYEEDVPALYSEELPDAYDSREHGVVTAVKNQSPYGNCWSYAAMAALESSQISAGAMSDLDLSEYQLCYYNYKYISDPLGGTDSDSVFYKRKNNADGGSFVEYLHSGGNILVAFHALTNWKGAVVEEAFPYEAGDGIEPEASMESAYDADTIHLQQFYQVKKTDMDAVKHEIMEHGAVTAAFYYTAQYYQTQTGGYYNHSVTGANHGAAIVGWDDHFSRENFKTVPSRDGAWLVKNSWGESFGQNGYIWLSYEDTSLQEAMCVMIGEDADNYDHNYQYDGSYYSVNLGVNKVANVFQVPSKLKPEALKAVSFELASTNVNYSIQIYRNLTDLKVPDSGVLATPKPITGSTTYQGYYTVTLPEEILLQPKESFAVVIEFEKDGGVRVVAEADKTWNNTVYTASCEENQSFYYKDGVWTDMYYRYPNNPESYGDSGNFRIKAFTVDRDRIMEFDDVNADEWYYSYIYIVYQKDWMVGKTSDLFRPVDALKRNEMAAILYKIAGQPVCTLDNPFLDVDNDSWYGNAVIWASNQGITAGIAPGLFGTNESITREQFLVMLYRYVNLEQNSAMNAEENVQVNLSEYEDVSDVSTWAREAVTWALSCGYLAGKPGTHGEKLLDPKGILTRAECATILSGLGGNET